MKIGINYVPTKHTMLVVWYKDDEGTLQRIAHWRDYFLFGKEFDNED